MHGYIGVKFLLNHGAFLSVAMSDAHAKRLVEWFSSGELTKTLDDKCCPPPPGHATKWSLLTSTIQAVHTFPLEPQAAGGTQYISGVPIR